MCIGLANGGYIEPKEEKKAVSLLKRKTNNDRINEMSVEEKVEFIDALISQCDPFECSECPLYEVCCGGLTTKQWLESEAEE